MNTLDERQTNTMPDSRASEGRTAQSNGSEVSAAVPAPVAHPGAPEGLAAGLLRKPGRPKGSLNRATKEVKAALRPTLPKAKKRLRELVECQDAEIAFKAVALILAYTYGKPTERREVTGAGGGPHLIEFLRELPG